jgi:hypothetical protein
MPLSNKGAPRLMGSPPGGAHIGWAAFLINYKNVLLILIH